VHHRLHHVHRLAVHSNLGMHLLENLVDVALEGDILMHC
jgi:hypothetical protein